MTSTSLGFVDSVLAHGRHFQQIGRNQDALRILCRLAGHRELPAPVAEEVQLRLGQIQLRRKKYARARRHFSAALRYAPESPRYHFLLAQAFEKDGDLARAAEHYRRSLDADATQADCLCAHGTLALRLNRTEEALESLRAAAQQAPDDLTVLAKVAAGLRNANRADEGRSLLLAARFRHPRDRRYLKLWNDFQFHVARRTQAAAQESRHSAAGDAPILLPFRRPAVDARSRTDVAGKIIRADGPSVATPHIGLPLRQSEKRQAQ